MASRSRNWATTPTVTVFVAWFLLCAISTVTVTAAGAPKICSIILNERYSTNIAKFSPNGADQRFTPTTNQDDWSAAVAVRHVPAASEPDTLALHVFVTLAKIPDNAALHEILVTFFAGVNVAGVDRQEYGSFIGEDDTKDTCSLGLVDDADVIRKTCTSTDVHPGDVGYSETEMVRKWHSRGFHFVWALTPTQISGTKEPQDVALVNFEIMFVFDVMESGRPPSSLVFWRLESGQVGLKKLLEDYEKAKQGKHGHGQCVRVEELEHVGKNVSPGTSDEIKDLVGLEHDHEGNTKATTTTTTETSVPSSSSSTTSEDEPSSTLQGQVSSTSSEDPGTGSKSSSSTSTPAHPDDDRPPLIESEDEIFTDIYKGCNKHSNCIGETQDCAVHRNCTLLISWFSGTEYFRYEMFGMVEGSHRGYVAMGHSFDDKMGDDSVVECTWLGGRRTGTYQSWNSVHNNTRFRGQEYECSPDTELGGDIARCNISVRTTSEGNTFILCNFLRKSKTVYNNITFDTKHDRWYLLAAVGTKVTEDHVGYHSRKVKSVDSLELWKAISYENPDADEEDDGTRTLFKLHGALMVIVWINIVPAASVIARYFKDTYTAYNCLKKPFWWWLHIGLLALGLALMLTSELVVLLTVDPSEIDAQTSSEHAIAGFTAIAIYVLLVVSGWFTYTPKGAKTKRMFAVFHALAGAAAEIIALVLIMLSGRLESPASLMPCYASIIVIFWILTRLVFFIIFGCHFNWLYEHLDEPEKVDQALNPLKPLEATLHGEAPAGKTRLQLLLVFVGFSFLWSMALVIGLAVEHKKLICDFATERES